MKVVIGDKIFDGKETAILLQLTAQDRIDIMGMAPYQSVIVTVPDDTNIDKVKKWVDNMSEKLKEE